MLVIYHNPQCRKSRAGVKFLQDHQMDFEIREYLKNPLTEKELNRLLVKLNMKPMEIVRKQEPFFKTKLKGKNFSDHEWIRILLENPRLIQRPIIEKQYKAVIGDPVENIEKIL